MTDKGELKGLMRDLITARERLIDAQDGRVEPSIDDAMAKVESMIEERPDNE